MRPEINSLALVDVVTAGWLYSTEEVVCAEEVCVIDRLSVAGSQTK